ncbi:exosortase A [Uliginosibacterium sp. sgz301328]|uniref:exosortase A n=1 Tax=Uliginosibacterium sp. sgz301328 TaxID=3243764 RepID=UPI00359D3EA5
MAPDEQATSLMSAQRSRLPLWLAGAAVLWVLALYAPTVAAMVGIWYRSDTFAHGFVVLPISLFLIWRARASLFGAGFAPAWGALVPLALCGALWLVGRTADVNAAMQAGVVGMAVCAVWACWGHRAAWAVLFPLAFVFFAVPFGEFLVPTLMQHTADFAVAAIRASGVPVYREGLYFIIPNGAWSVVEACSGIRYLIASVMVGALFAYLNYTSALRRVLFFAAAIVVPLVANWLRAYMIVMLGYLSDNRIAAGVDHLIYGWLFFGVVIFLLFWVGSWWREDAMPLVAATAPAPRTASVARHALMLAAVLIVSGVWLPLHAVLAAPRQATSITLQAPAARDGWQTADTTVPWQPVYEGARAHLVHSYRKGDALVTLHIYYYAAQAPGRELVQWGNRLIPGESNVWRIVGAQTEAAPVAGEPLQVQYTEIAGAQRAAVWHWLWLGDGETTLSDQRAKLALLRDRLMRQPDDGAAVFVVSDMTQGSTVARQALADFMRAHRDGIDAALAGARP